MDVATCPNCQGHELTFTDKHAALDQSELVPEEFLADTLTTMANAMVDIRNMMAADR